METYNGIRGVEVSWEKLNFFAGFKISRNFSHTRVSAPLDAHIQTCT